MSEYPLSEDELDEVIGKPEPWPVPPVKLVTGNPDHEMPSADELNEDQTTEAVWRVFENTSTYPRFPWGELDEVAGLMCPEDLWLIAGRTGNGKSLFCLNLFDRMIEAGRRVLYVGLEQSPKVLRIKWACMRAGVPPKQILAIRQEDKKTPEYEAARDLITAELKWQSEPDIKLRAHFSATRFVDREQLVAWTDWAVDMGCEIVIVDHIDRMKHGTGANSFHELSETVRLAKELAVEHRIVMMVASQVGRPKEALQKFMPPMTSELRGGGTKEEEADAILAVYRPLKRGTTEKQMTLVRQGLLEEHEIYEHNAMAVRVLKHRLDGEASKTAILDVVKGRLQGRPTRDFGRYDV
jgi:replicative DNA helicase